ncbi:zinc finger protein ush-like [Argiope bruennichi]|uniref:zinc finger protein ush-like n=1 Tax=Argiope bruennichi TaxID=94029 RepID=UPI00249498DC|nr:zinc finger protein ush-like [Argiope bruennichi]
MSRRKQSNPKPLKRKTEDSLEEVAELLHLPVDLFSVRDPEDDVYEYTVFTKQRVREGAQFGPYGGHVTKDQKESSNVIETKGPDGEDMLFSVTDDFGGWLKLLRPATSSGACNAALYHNESSVWCRIITDIDPDTEILVNHRWTNSPTPLCFTAKDKREDFEPRTHSKHLLHKNKLHRIPARNALENDQHTQEDDAFREKERNNMEFDAEQVSDLRKRSHQYSDENARGHNGSVSSDSVVKYEPTSPISPNCSAASPTSMEISKSEVAQNEPDGPLCMPYLNGCNYPPAFPYSGSLTDTVSEGQFKCDVCNITFNSRRILEVHQTYYCQGKIFGTTISSDTDTEDNSSNIKSDSRTIESPTTFEDREKQLQKEFPCAKNLHQETVGSNESPILAKRRRMTSANDAPVASTRLTRLFKCPYCSYSSDKKASLTRHVRMHGASPSADGHADMPLPTPPMARYCTNCDIQFASYKNYQVHKEFYCSTRHVHKTINPSTSPSSGQQLQQQLQTPQQQPVNLPNQPRSPENSTATTESDAKGFNMVLNQPLYAAISTSPLILVPCSYVAGGGLSPAAGLIPAGNIIIPNPSTTPDSASDSQGGNVIPTYTVMPGATVAELSSASSPLSGEDAAKEEVKPAKITKEKAVKPNPSKSPKHTSKEDPEKPLDLSFKKKEGESDKAIMPKPSPDNGSRSSNFSLPSSSASSSSEESCPVPVGGPSMPILPLINPAADLSLIARSGLDSNGPTVAPVLPPPQVLVKQGTSKCKECNIVFYKYENYLVHKNRYCASRLQPKQEVNSPERGKSDEPESPEREESAPRISQKSPISSPRVNNARTPPVPDIAEARETSPSQQPSAAMLQFYCMACGIKYTSIDNLRAHQQYYCPKRDMNVPHPVALIPSFSRNTHEFKCGKCKNAYPTEELLRQHPCVVQRKCPYCDVYCPTLSAAQRHLVTHTGIKSFRCSLCGYKGHTLRGMRTHIRIHLDKNSSTPEEAYILCMDEGGAEIGCASRKSPGSRMNLDRIKSVITTEPPQGEASMAVSPVAGLPPAILPAEVVAIKAVPDDTVATGDTTHWCQICGYSSSYKGNVVRHVKLVHKDLVSTQTMSNIVNSRPSVEPPSKQNDSNEPISRVTPHDSFLSASNTEHSNSSSSVDVKPMVNGILNKAEQQLRVEDKALMLKTETVSPPPKSPTTDSATASKGVKRPLSEEGQCPSGNFNSKAGPKYCKSCDISFNYLSNFLAHKRFYCTPKSGEVSGQETNSVQSVQ